MNAKQAVATVPAPPPFDPQAMTLTLADLGERSELEGASAELTREIQVRDRCYGRWVAEGRLAKSDATDRYNRLQVGLALVTKVLDCYPQVDVQVPYGTAEVG